MQCLRSLPDDEALVVADSAARAGELAMLARLGATSSGRGAARIRQKVAEARADAANPFESVLRSLSNSVEGLHVEPQRLITSVKSWVRPDLVDEDLRIVLEADSFEWHGNRAALRRDARRYDLLVVDGWIVLRFAWEDVMFDQGFVRSVLVAAVDLACRRTKPSCSRCGAS
jgi:very-short-patch-repair endonuclease